MPNRRTFLKNGIKVLAAAVGIAAGFSTWPERLYAAAKRWVVPKGTSVETLTDRKPANLDTTELEVTPIQRFRTMGRTQAGIDVNAWRLKVDGAVGTPLELSYKEMTALPSFEKKVLIICPGVFAYVGLWKGFALWPLLEKAGLQEGAAKVVFKGPDEPGGTSRTYPLEEVRDGKVFAAYGVNGQVLPEKHGFPLRIVAEDHHGYDWVKFLSRITVE